MAAVIILRVKFCGREDYVEQGGGGDGGNAYLFPADRDTRGCADNTVAESALSGTEGSQKTDGPTAGTIPGIP